MLKSKRNRAGTLTLTGVVVVGLLSLACNKSNEAAGSGSGAGSGAAVDTKAAAKGESTATTCPAVAKKVVAIFVAAGAGADSLIKAGSEPALEADCTKRDWINKNADGVKCVQETKDLKTMTPDCDKKMMKMIMGS